MIHSKFPICATVGTAALLLAAFPVATASAAESAPPGGLGIVNTDEIAKPGEFPWMAGVVSDGLPYCGGTLISPDLVLTAGHCPDATHHGEEVVVGSVNITDPHAIHDPVVDFRKGDVDPFFADNDWQVLKLKNKLDIKPVSLDLTGVANAPGVGRVPLETMGWGMHGWGSPGTPNDPWFDGLLRKAAVPYLPNNECLPRAYPFFNAKTMLCTGAHDPNENFVPSPGNGDSGGPLVVKQPTGSWTEVGIISHGKNPYHGAAVYTKVSAFSDQITKAMEELGG